MIGVFVGWILGLATALAIATYNHSGAWRDSTDFPAPAPRSGLIVRTDAATGCEYLSSAGGVTPRLDASGQPCGSAK